MKYSLPDSANDLLIKDGKLLMRTLSVYEILRRFGHIIRLTPFRFEDFSAALLADEQSPLIAEIHIQLLKTLVREDRQQQTWLGPPDLRDSINIYLHSADHVNWPAALRIYLSADNRENSSILDKLTTNKSKDYPFKVDLQIKLGVLEHLCDQFLLSNLARDEIVNGNNSTYKHDTTCRSCSKPNGDLVSCGSCVAVYHLKCSDPPLENYPDAEDGYSCAVCRSNHVVGVSDCIGPYENSGNLKRHEPLGMDKLGRRYWFLVRRLFVVDENEEDIRYYTTCKQLEEIVESLNENRYEKSLIDNLQEQRDEIERQMKITEDLRESLLEECKKDESSSLDLGQDGAHKNYINQYSSSNLALGKSQHSDRDVNRSLSNKFSMNSLNSFKWHGAINGHLTSVSVTIKTTILKFEAMLPPTFKHPCWQAHRSNWLKLVNYGQNPEDFALALSQLETCVKPVLFKTVWYDGVGFCQLFRSTFAEREELKKTDRQPRGFERREWFSQDFELSYRLGTMVKFSPKLKPVKHQVWKQKGEEYRLTGLNGWYWKSSTFRSRTKTRSKAKPYEWLNLAKQRDSVGKKSVFLKPKLPPCHDFLTKRNKLRSILVLPNIELHKLARSGGMRETKSFSYTAKQSSYVWPYGMTPRPAFRTCWLYKNRTINTVQDVALQLKIIYSCIRWDDLQARPPATGHNVIITDEATVTIELLKKRDRLPYLTHSEYLIKKVTTPIEQPTKYRKIGSKKSTPSARSGLRARQQTEEDEIRGPTTEEIWVSEGQLELWELKQFDEKIERQNQLMREKALKEEAEKRRKIEEEKRRKVEEEKRRKAEQERIRKTEEDAKKVRLNLVSPSTSQTNNLAISQPRSLPTTPVLRYFRTEQGQIIRLPASYLQRGTPLILRHVGPGPNQTHTYIIRPQITLIPATAAATPTTQVATIITTTTTTSTSTPATTTTTTSTVNSNPLSTSTIIPLSTPICPSIPTPISNPTPAPAPTPTSISTHISTANPTSTLASSPVTTTTTPTSTLSSTPVTTTTPTPTLSSSPISTPTPTTTFALIPISALASNSNSDLATTSTSASNSTTIPIPSSNPTIATNHKALEETKE